MNNNPYTNVEDKQTSLFDDEEWWAEHWQDMPEFEQAKQKSFSEIIVRVRDEQALAVLSELLGQRLTAKTKSAWFPAVERGWGCSGEYASES